MRSSSCAHTDAEQDTVTTPRALAGRLRLQRDHVAHGVSPDSLHLGQETVGLEALADLIEGQPERARAAAIRGHSATMANS